MPNFDSIFDDIHALRAARSCDFKEAVSFNLASESVTYASTKTLPAKVLWRDDTTEFERGVWQEEDRASLVIWIKDLIGNRTATSGEIASLTAGFKGNVNEASRENWSRFDVDGQALKARAVFPLERPDGKVFAIKIVLQAAES